MKLFYSKVLPLIFTRVTVLNVKIFIFQIKAVFSKLSIYQ